MAQDDKRSDNLHEDTLERCASYDPDATERRHMGEYDPEATIRRPAVDTEATQRRESDTDATMRRSLPGVSDTTEEKIQQEADLFFPCEINGRVVRLEVIKPMGRGGEGQLYLCTDGEQLYAAKILQRDSDYQILDAMIQRKDDLAAKHLVPSLWLGRMSEVYGTPLASGRYIIHPYYERGDMASLDNMRAINPSISYDGDESSFHPCADEYVHIECDYGQVNEKAFTELVSQLADALSALHDTTLVDSSDGTMHRDIKPQNIFVDGDGNYALGDFGLVSAMNTGVNQNFTERVGLSHGYSPPEAYSDPRFRQRVTRKYDYFSLGMTLLHIAGGRPRYIIDPAVGESDIHFTSLADYYEIIQSSSVNVPHQMPERVRHLIQGLVAANSEDRWGENEVRRWLAGENPLVPESGSGSQSGISLYAEGKVQRGAAEVADVLSRNWAQYRDELSSGELALAWDSADPAYQKAVERAAATAQFQDPDIALQTLILTIYPRIGHVFGGRRYDTDDSLGTAMLEAASIPEADDRAFFTDMLKKGALSNAWRMSSGGRSEKKLRAVLQIEEGANDHPLAALYAAGALLTGRRLDPVTVETRYSSLTFNSAQHLLEWVQDSFGRAVHKYADQKVIYEDPPHIPGRWELRDATVCLRQIDGSVLVNSGRVLGPFPVEGELLALAQFALHPSDEPETRRAGERLYAILYRDGYLGTIGLPDPAQGSYSTGFVPEVLIDFLAMFPDVRKNHAFDDMFLDMLDAHVGRLQYISGVKLPGAAKGQNAQVDYEVQKIRDAVLRFRRTRFFEDFAAAVRQSNAGREVLVKIRTPNFEAADKMLRLVPLIMSSPDERMRERFNKIVSRHSVLTGDLAELTAINDELNELNTYIESLKHSDLSPYLMSDTMLFIRNYNSTSDRPLEIVLPSTTDAAKYYDELAAQVQQHRRRLTGQGITDEEGRRLR